MGWSCTYQAGMALELIKDNLLSRSNSWIGDNGNEYFFEIGRENNDGAITGSIFEIYDGKHIKRVGGFRIEPDGKIKRFPYLPNKVKEKIFGNIS